MKILVLHLIMCNNNLTAFYLLTVIKITFFLLFIFDYKFGFKTGSKWRKNGYES